MKVRLIIILSFLTTSLYAQMSTQLEQKFKTKVSDAYQEKVYLHTDRSAYIIGETIWLKAYLVDAMTHQLSDVSKVLNLEIINKDNKAVKQERIRMKDGTGNGQIFISADIPSGHYSLIAYTNWMKNFDPQLVFNTEIDIINPEENQKTDKQFTKDTTHIVSFFPEGGHLVMGLKSKLAIKVNNSGGEGYAIKGIVYDQYKSEVVHFETNKRGYGSFWIDVKENMSYHAKISINGVITEHKLPEPKDSGINLSVVKNNSSELSVGINRKAGNNKEYFLLAHLRGKLIDLKKLNKSTSTINFEKQHLDDGIIHLSILNTNFDPIAERLVFNHPDISGSTVELSKSEFSQREIVELNIPNNLLLNNAEIAQLSISIALNPSGSRKSNIISDLLFTSDLRGHIEDPWHYMNPLNENRKGEIDLIMLTHGWRRFSWKNFTNADQNNSHTYPAEINAPLLSGKINTSGTYRVSATFPGKAAYINTIDVNKQGDFHLEVPFRIANEYVYFFNNEDSLNTKDITLNSPFDLHFQGRHKQKLLQPYLKHYYETLNLNTQVSQVYRSLNHINGKAITRPEVITQFYGEPDFAYVLDDYTRFETVKDLFLEFIRSAVIRKTKKRQGIYVTDNDVFDDPALVLLDGIPLRQTEEILAIDPMKIERIDVLNHNYYMGSQKIPGIVSFTSFKGDFNDKEIPEFVLKKAYNSLQTPREFYHPNYSTLPKSMKRIPDLRNTLYWNSNLTLTKEKDIDLSFFTSDHEGIYSIEVNGIDSNGTPIYIQKTIDVNANSEPN